MKDKIINIKNLTKDYGHGRGVFNVSIAVKEGECYGFLGPNGAGKTTTIRHLMGFSKPQEGNCSIMGMDVWKDATELKKYISYVPGEIFFPNVGSGTNFLKLQAEYLGIKDLTYLICLSWRVPMRCREMTNSHWKISWNQMIKMTIK